ncbi:MAG: Holliday junction branch migration protein RuvA [Lachnospiraceae bacterium]
MYAYIKGELAERADGFIVVEAGGIGYQIFIAVNALEYLPAIGEEIKVYTHLNIKEDAMDLFGFLTKDDKNIFRLLLGVNGIGPKGALAILSTLTADDLRFAVLGDDAKAIAKSPGIGAKTAQRVILELKDKIYIQDILGNSHHDDLGSKADLKEDSNKSEAIDALMALGYSSQEAVSVVSRIEITESTTVEEILKQALKNMAFL